MENVSARKARLLMVRGGEAEDKEFVELGMEEDTEEGEGKSKTHAVRPGECPCRTL